MNYLIVALLLIVQLGYGATKQNNTKWQLKTEDTRLTLSVEHNRLLILELKNTHNGWNWIKESAEMPLPKQIQMGNENVSVDWVFQNAKMEHVNGNRLTVRFNSNSPNLFLESVWQAKPGVGPIENQVSLINKSGKSLQIKDQDVVSADLAFTSDSLVTLWHFNKGRYLVRKLKEDKPIVKADILKENSDISYYLSNDANGSTPKGLNSQLPFQMYDVNGRHGLYLGYEWSFGQFKNKTGKNPLQINYKSYLWDSLAVVIESEKVFKMPAVFFGTYVGNVDDGSNRMKRWFWNHKITQTLKDHPDEPLIEYCIPGNETQLTEYYQKYPVAQWGAELGKIDIDWLDGSSSDWTKGDFKKYAFWKPDSLKWPKGMTAGDIVHQNSQKLSLYMNFTFEWTDIATKEGREKEKKALLTRYDNWHYDYWRSDMKLEAKFDYLSHEGLLEILDYMIEKRPNFRYEHCGNGGLLKDFTTLQRITVLTNEDSGGPECHRESFYSCSYMINPVQLKTDVGMNLGPLGEVPNKAGYAPSGGTINDSPQWVKYILRTGFMGANMATNWCVYTPNQIDGVKEHWPLYKSKQRPILRGLKVGDAPADVYHILPAPDGINWDGIEYYNTSLKKGSILLFKPSESVASSKVIKLSGLEKKRKYTLTFQDRTEQNSVKSGAELMTNGLEVKGLTGSYASEIIWIN